MKAPKFSSIDQFIGSQAAADRDICTALREIIDHHLPMAESRIWHAHPVWFLDGNPVVGFSKLKSCVRLLFWSGQSFASPGLSPEGTFQAAEARYTSAGQIDRDLLALWLEEARTVQWDYKNLMKKGRLERIA